MYCYVCVCVCVCRLGSGSRASGSGTCARRPRASSPPRLNPSTPTTGNQPTHTHPPTNPSIHPSIHPSMHTLTHPSMHTHSLIHLKRLTHSLIHILSRALHSTVTVWTGLHTRILLFYIYYGMCLTPLMSSATITRFKLNCQITLTHQNETTTPDGSI